jgi:hypothetical protein
MIHFVRIESHRLSDGGLAEIEKAGRTYTFMRSYPTIEQAPDITLGLCLREALALLADTLRADVTDQNS